jgi:hypothetical protein
MKSNHDVMGEFVNALKKYRKICSFDIKHVQPFLALKKKYDMLQQRGLVLKMVDNLSSSAAVSKQTLLSFLAFNDWCMFAKMTSKKV